MDVAALKAGRGPFGSGKHTAKDASSEEGQKNDGLTGRKPAVGMCRSIGGHAAVAMRRLLDGITMCCMLLLFASV